MRPLRAAPHSLLTTKDLHARRFTTKDIEALVKWCWLIRLHRGVYFVPAPDVLARGALMAAGDGATLCGASALAHLDLRLRELGPVHLNAPRHRRDRPHRVKFHRARIDETDVIELRGLRTTSATRTLLDVAPGQPRYALLRALEQADRMRLHVDRARLNPCPQLAQPLQLLDYYGPCTRSDAEAMFLVLCEDNGIARPLVNQTLRGREADFHWPVADLVVEVDGFEFHDGLSAFRNDRRRGAVFRRDGYEVIRFDADQVAREPREVARTVLAARPQLGRWDASAR